MYLVDVSLGFQGCYILVKPHYEYSTSYHWLNELDVNFVPENESDIINPRLERDLSMDFDSAKKQFDRLTRLFNADQISHEEYVKGVDQLALIDEQGIEWQIGIQSGQWYRLEDREWVQDDPQAFQAIQPPPIHSEKKRSPCLWFLAALILLLALIWWTAPQLLGAGHTSKGDEGSLSGDEIPGLSTLQNDRAGGGQAENPEEWPSATPEPGFELESTPTERSTPQPTMFATLPPPPPPRNQPQIWQERQSLTLDEGMVLTKDNDWYYLDKLPWEYEFLTRDGKRALLLQFNEDIDLWLESQQKFEDTERKITLALPSKVGQIFLFCRWNPEENSGYALRLTSQTWTLSVFKEGIQTLLKEGSQSVNFREGGFETFRLHCSGDEIIVWAAGSRRSVVVNDQYSQGVSVLRFGVTEGVGVAFVAEDHLLVRSTQTTIAQTQEIVRLGAFDVQYLGHIREYPQVQSSSYAGEPVIGLVLRVVNHEDTLIQIGKENIYLENQEQRIYPLSMSNQEGDQQAGEDFGPLFFPLNLNREEMMGRVFFAGLSPDQLAGWQLVVDLKNTGYEEARFEISN